MVSLAIVWSVALLMNYQPLSVGWHGGTTECIRSFQSIPSLRGPWMPMIDAQCDVPGTPISFSFVARNSGWLGVKIDHIDNPGFGGGFDPFLSRASATNDRSGNPELRDSYDQLLLESRRTFAPFELPAGRSTYLRFATRLRDCEGSGFTSIVGVSYRVLWFTRHDRLPVAVRFNCGPALTKN